MPDADGSMPADATYEWAAPGGRGEPQHEHATAVEFAAFYKDFMPTLVAFLIWHGSQLADAADLAQEAMVETYRRWGTVGSPRAYVRKIALQLMSRTPRNLPDHSPLIPPMSDLVAWEQRYDILGALKKLPARQREILARTLDGDKPSEIAKELGITQEAVRSSLLKARRSLAWHLGTGADLV